MNKTEFNWKKLGKIFDPTKFDGRPWLKEFAQAPSTLIFEDFVRVYFSCRPPADENGKYVSHTAFADFDRKDLTRLLRVSENPILPLGDLGEFDEFGIYPASVIRDGDKFLAYYAGWTRCESVPYNTAIGLAESHDGVSFKRIGTGPILAYSPDEPMTVSGPKIRIFDGKWYLWYVAGKKWRLANGRYESIFKIKMATSTDGYDWKKENRDLLPSILEEDECQASPDVIKIDNKFHMFFSYKYGSNFRNNDRGYRIGYASSDDAINWHRDDSKCGIGISPPGHFDDQSIAYPHVFELDGKMYMMYLGNEVGRFGFGLAVLDY